MRELGPEEQALWAKVTQAVRRLHAEPPPVTAVPLPAEAAPSAAPAPPPRKMRGRIPPVRQPVAAMPMPRPGTLDGSWDKKLGSGRVDVDRVVDLHGHDLDGAWGLIDREIDEALDQGERVLLLITGKPPRDVQPHARGRIRAAVGDWLRASRHAGRIAAVRPAAQRHGGAGALYVVLRRVRT